MKKMAIITEKDFLIRDASEIEKVIFVGDDFVIENIPMEHIEKLNKQLKSYVEYEGLSEEEIDQIEEEYGCRMETSNMDMDELERFFEWAGYDDVEINNGDEDGEKPRSFIVYTEDNKLHPYTAYEESMVYDWFDGQNWKRFSFDSAFFLDVTGEAISLDEWDENARGFVAGGSNEHQKVYKVITVDGQLQRDQYLIEKWDDYQGSYPLGELCDVSYLESHLKDLGRNVEEYIEEIKNLGNVELPLVGMKEFAEILGWSVQRLSKKWKGQREGKKVRPELPEPIQALASTPIWTLEQAQEYRALASDDE